MTTIDQAEALAISKDYPAAKALCLELIKKGVTGIRLQFLLGSIALNMNDSEEALRIFRSLVKTAPNHSGVLNNLGAAIDRTGGDLDEAQSLIERSIEIDPKNIPAMVNLGELYLSRKKTDKARETYSRIAKLAPNNPQGPFGEGLCDLSINEYEKAYERFEAAIKLAPHHPAVLANLLHAATQTKRHSRAIEISRLIASKEEFAGQLPIAWAILKRYCIWDEASAILPKVVNMLLSNGTTPDQFIPIALEVLSSPNIDHATLKDLHVRCGDGLRLRNKGFPLPSLEKAYAPSKRMRIGYLSGDFRHHVAALFIRGIVNHHDPGAFEIFLYNAAPIGVHDRMTGGFFRVAEHFVQCHDMDVGELSQRIAEDGIHILVDLSGYTAHTRMQVLSLKPAPVQISYIGYPGTYGLKEVDYILSTPDLTGTDHASAFVETPLELPGLYAVTPSPLTVKRSAELAFLRNGHITFGSLINPYKINPETVALWARVMRETPQSRIYLNHPAYVCSEAKENLITRFAAAGIVEERLTITPERPPEGEIHYVLYDHIDIVLDATPMTGGAGTTDALTVGVPVISRLGSIFHERLSSAAIRANVATPEEFLAETDDDFVAKAVALAQNPERLKELRQQIRQAILTGPNSQAEAFTRQLELTYKQAWNRLHPELPIDTLVSWSPNTETVTVGQFTLEVLARRNDLYRFVARDTGHWFEHECDFIAHHAAAFGTLLDVSHDPGLVVVPVAAALPETAHLYCQRDLPHYGKLLMRNLATNSLEERVTVCPTLDTLAPPTLVRIAAECNDAQASVVRDLFERLEFTPAILLVSLDSPNGPELATVNYLRERGYGCYLHHTGAQILIARSLVTPEDSFVRNVFCIQDAAIPLLQEHGLVASPTNTFNYLPDSHSDAWKDVARQPELNFSTNADPAYLGALNAYACSQNQNCPANERLHQFNLAELLLSQLVLAKASVPRLFSLIRLKSEAGKRDGAIALANQLADALAQSHGQVLDEPYLLPIGEVAEFNEDEAVWAHSVALMSLERLRSWSPFFTAAESTLLWKELSTLPWCRALAQRKLALLGTMWETAD
jgi:protein O-GlcNAc transferase